MSAADTAISRTQPLPPNVGASEAVYSKVGWRIIPLLLIAYMIAYLDRINIGYAQLQMKQTLPFGDAVYGIGAGIFFLGYFLFVPSKTNSPPRAIDMLTRPIPHPMIGG